MDIGDLIFLILLGIGFLSSLGGAKKRRTKQGSPRPAQPRPERHPAATSRAPDGQPSRKSRLQEARNRVKSQMQDLLRELEQQSQPPLPAPPVPGEIPQRKQVPAPASRTGPLAVESLEVIGDEIEIREVLHKEFHKKYMSPVSDPARRSGRPRVRRLMGHRSLREAVVLTEILGPPKSLQ